MRHAWKWMAPKDRLRYVYVPLAAAVLGALVAVGTVRALNSIDSHEAKVSVVDIVPNEMKEEYSRKPYFSVKLRNTGDRRAVLTRLHVTIYNAQYMVGCQPLGGSGTVETGRYSVKLPAHAEPGTREELVLNQEIGSDEVDRFGITFETPNLEGGINVMYEVGMSVEMDDSSQPLPLGRFLLMTPEPLPKEALPFWFATPKNGRELAYELFEGDPDLAYTLPCYRQHLRGFGPFLESSAQRSRRTAAIVDYVRDLH